MKIMQTPKDIEIHNIKKYEANKNCYRCPTCGITKIRGAFDIVNSKDKNYITKMTFHATYDTLFSCKSGTINYYKCNKCGTEWESEMY